MNHHAGSIAIYSSSEKIWGGGQIYIEQLCQYLNQAGQRSVIVTPEPETFNCPTLLMDSVAARSTRLWLSFRLASQLKKKGVETIILNDLSALWLAPIFRARGFKVFALLHLALARRNASGLGHSFPEYWLLWLSSYFCHAIASVNKNNIGLLPRKVSFVGNYVPGWFFEGERRTPIYDFVMVARFSKQKNIGLFIQMLANMRESHGRPYSALLVGEGPEHEEILDAITHYGLQESVTIQPWAQRHELPATYDQGRCFVISSHHEGFATTLLEAHARGIPAITTRRAGFCAEFIESYGTQTGLVYEPEDVGNVDFLNDVARLVANHSDLSSACIDKARLFSEDVVLGSIKRQLDDV